MMDEILNDGVIAGELGVYLKPIGSHDDNPFDAPTGEGKIPTYHDGDKVDFNWRKNDYRFICCNCDFVHRIRFVVAGDKIRMRVFKEVAQLEAENEALRKITGWRVKSVQDGVLYIEEKEDA
jgi:hypothetical protein